MAAVEALGVNAVDVTHHSRQVGLARMQHQMVVVAHQAVREQFSIEALERQGQHIKMQHAIFVVAINRLSAVTTRRDVMDRTWERESKRTSHANECGLS